MAKKAKKTKEEFEETGKVDIVMLQPRLFPLEEVVEKMEVTPNLVLPRRKHGEFKGNPSRCATLCGGSMTKGTCARCGKVMP